MTVQYKVWFIEALCAYFLYTGAKSVCILPVVGNDCSWWVKTQLMCNLKLLQLVSASVK